MPEGVDGEVTALGGSACLANFNNAKTAISFYIKIRMTAQTRDKNINFISYFFNGLACLHIY